MRISLSLLADRRIVLLLATSALAVVFGFLVLTPDQSLSVITTFGYWAMLLATAAFVWSLIQLARESGPLDLRAKWRDGPRWPMLLIAACGALLLVHERYGFKILMDEAMLLGTSMSMHFDKVPLVPMRGNDIHGAFQIINGQLDKRPLFQPFLTSVVHDFTGYRPENIFILNSALTFVLLGLAYEVARKVAGRVAGAAAVLLLTSLPLLAQNATGGGFEVLNLVMILATLRLGMRYAERRDASSQTALVLSGILLAQTRYESVLFLLPVGLLIAWGWWREQRPVLDTLFCFTPLFLLPYPLHNKVFSVRTSSWELASQPGYDVPFSPKYIADNVGHALNFFFNLNGEQSNSLVIAVLGLLAAPFFALWTYKVLKAQRTSDPARVALAFFALGFAAHTLLLLCYFWGKFDDPVIRRLSLPLNLALVLGVIAVTSEMARSAFRFVVAASIAGVFAHSLPAMARHDYTLDYYIGREAEWRREFIAAHPEKDYLVIDNSSIFWITHLVSATPMLQATTKKENIIFHFRNKSFSATYVFQRLQVNSDTGELTLLPDEDLGPDYQLEPVWERRFTPLTVSRISRVTAIKEGPLTPPERKPPPKIDTLSPVEQEKIRQRYFEAFIQKLP